MIIIIIDQIKVLIKEFITKFMNIDSPVLQTTLENIRTQKKRIESQISVIFEQIKKKIYKQIEKAQKKYLSTINDAINVSLSYILKQTTDGILTSDYPCFRKAKKFTNSLQQICMTDISKELQLILKNISEKFKNIKCQKIKPIEQQNHILLKNTLHSTEKVHKIEIVNGQLIQFKQGCIYSENNSISIKYDIKTATKVTFPNKSKEYIACFNEGQLKLMNNKLTLIGIKTGLPFKDIIRVLQMKQYLYVIQKEALHRMDLNNLNSIKTQVFGKKIIDCFTNNHLNSLVVICAGYIYYLNQQLEIYFESQKVREIVNQKFYDDKALMMTSNSVYIEENLRSVGEILIENPLQILKISENAFLVISGTGQCFILNESQNDGDRKFEVHRYAKEHTAKIKQVINGKDLIYCLSEGQKKIYVYQFC